jgi:hypothetical protein
MLSIKTIVLRMLSGIYAELIWWLFQVRLEQVEGVEVTCLNTRNQFKFMKQQKFGDKV